MHKKLIVIGLALGLSVPVSFVAHPANAATSDAIAQALVTATLQNLGVNEISTGLSQQLTGQLTKAIDAGVIDPAISAQVASLLENPALISGLSDVFNDHLDGETSVWRSSEMSNDVSTGTTDENSDGLDPGNGDENNPGDDGSGDGTDDGSGDGTDDGSGDGTDDESDSGSSDDDSGDDNESGNSGGGRDDNEDDDDWGDYEDDALDDNAYGMPGPVATFPSRLRRTFTQ